MFCRVWLLFQALAVVVEGGASSGSVEALVNGGVNNNRVAAAGNNAGAQNGVPLNGDAIVGRLVQLGGSYFIQPVGNPAGQQMIPITALQQGGAATAAQAGGANRNLPGQLTQQGGGAPVTLFAVLPQGNIGGAPQNFMMPQGQLQLIPVIDNQGRAGRVGARFLRSLAARPGGTASPQRTPMAAEEEEEEEEEEEGSGDLIEDNQEI